MFFFAMQALLSLDLCQSQQFIHIIARDARPFLLSYGDLLLLLQLLLLLLHLCLCECLLYQLVLEDPHVILCGEKLLHLLQLMLLHFELFRYHFENIFNRVRFDLSGQETPSTGHEGTLVRRIRVLLNDLDLMCLGDEHAHLPI